MIQCCKTCIYSRWTLTKTGRIVRDSTGLCTAPLPVVVLPDSVTKQYGYHEWRVGRVSPEDGRQCPLYASTAGKPLSERLG